MREIQDIMDIFPYCLLVALPIMIFLSPAAIAVGHEFPAHRLAQFQLGDIPRGPKSAALSMDARALPNEANVNLLRKTIVAKLQDLSVAAFNDLVSSGAGGILILIPSSENLLKISEEKKEIINALQDHLHTTEFEIPVYFSEESEQLLELLESLGGEAHTDKKSTSAASDMFSSLVKYGYQMVTSSTAVPKAIPDPQSVSIESVLRGSHGEEGNNEAQPTIVVVAHYDSNSIAPSLPTGVDSNGSGVAILLELARIFGKMYASSRSRPPMGLAFLLSSGGAMNYFGTKKWLEHHLDHDSQFELLSDVPFVTCLDTLAGKDLKMHVSKPPKADSHAGKFLANLGTKVELVHKKINLADEILAWEHERFSIRRIPAFTLSRLSSFDTMERSSLMDQYVDVDLVYNQVKTIGEALACTLYNYADEGCSGNVLTGSLAPSMDHLASWIDHAADTPRHISMTSSKNDPHVQALFNAMKSNVGADNVRTLNAKRDTREPEFIIYDSPQTVLTAYKVKSAVFDLVLTLCIGAYLGLVYLALWKSGTFVALVSQLTTSTNNSNSNANGKTNGTLLNNNHSNGHFKVK